VCRGEQKHRKTGKKITKKTKPWKKPTGSIRFRFYTPETEKTEPKPKKTDPNRFELVFVLNKPNQNRSVWTGFGFFKKKFNLINFFDKNQTKSKMTISYKSYAKNDLITFV
jgi:hypothetical protein